MDCNTGDIKTMKQLAVLEGVTVKEFEDCIPKPWAPIPHGTDLTKIKHMGKQRRRNWMRNQPCVCGSGVKFKKCCWLKFSS